MSEINPFDSVLDHADILVPRAPVRLWRMTSRYLLRPGEFAEEGVTPEWEALALPLPNYRLTSVLAGRGSVANEISPAYLASDESTARAEFLKRWPTATRYKLWSFEIEFAACLDLTEPRIESIVDPAKLLSDSHDAWVPLFRAAWKRDIEVIRFRSFTRRDEGGSCFAVLKLRPGTFFSEPRPESRS